MSTKTRSSKSTKQFQTYKSTREAKLETLRRKSIRQAKYQTR